LLDDDGSGCADADDERGSGRNGARGDERPQNHSL
jgi:hypothetical protein